MADTTKADATTFVPIAGAEPARGRSGGPGITWPIMRGAVDH